MLEGQHKLDRTLWKGLAEMGLLGIAIPEAFGGAGAGYLELCVVAEELGRTLAPVPYSSTVYLASELLLLAGSTEQKQRWLPKIAAGTRSEHWRWSRASAMRRRGRSRFPRAAARSPGPSRWSPTARSPISPSSSLAPVPATTSVASASTSSI